MPPDPPIRARSTRVFKATPTFWKAFMKLDRVEQDLARQKFLIFREDPFDASLGTHRINRLSAIYKKTVYSACLAGDLRAVFYVEGNTVVSVGIGNHAIYG